MSKHFKTISSRVAQWKRAGPITQRSEDQNLALLEFFYYSKNV